MIQPSTGVLAALPRPVSTGRSYSRPPWRDLPVFILAGGLGTRLRSAVANVPKVLAPVQGRPFLAHLLDRVAAASLRRVVLLTGFQAEAVEATFGERCGPLELTYSRETSPLGTGGAVRQALCQVNAETLLLLNGDSWCDVDLRVFFAQHCRRRPAISMVVTRVADASRYGAIRMASSDAITGFAEKESTAGPGWINAGIYLIQREVLEELPARKPTSLERDWLPRWIAAREVIGFHSSGPFLDIGTPDSYAAAAAFFGPKCDRP